MAAFLLAAKHILGVIFHATGSFKLAKLEKSERISGFVTTKTAGKNNFLPVKTSKILYNGRPANTSETRKTGKICYTGKGRSASCRAGQKTPTQTISV